MARKLEVVITGDSKGLERAYNRAGDATGKFGSKLGTLTKAGLIGAAVGGTALLAKGLHSSGLAAMEAEKAQAALEAQLKASGISYEESAGTIDKTVQSLSRMAGLDDEDLTSAFTRLVRSTGDVKKAQEQMTLVADIARAKQMDVGAAAEIVGKALSGNTGILKRYGVEVEKGMSVTAALGVAQQTFAGQAEAYGKTTAGAQDRVKVSVENVQEAIGAKLLPAFNQMLAWASKQLPKVEAFFQTHGGSIRKVFDGIVGFIRSTWVPMFNVAKQVGEAMIAGVRKFMDQHGTEVERIFGRIKTAVQTVATVMLFLAEKVVLPIMGPVFRTVLPTVLGITVSAIDKVSAAIAKVIDAFKWVGANAVAIWKRVAGALAGPLGALTSALQPLGSALAWIAGTLGKIPELVQKAAAALSKVSGLISGAAGVIGKIPGLAAGGPVSAGQAYVVGEKGPELFVPGSSGTIVPNTSSPSRAPSGMGGGTVINVTVNGAVGAPHEIAEVFRRELIKIGRNNAGNLFAGMA